MSSDKAIVEVLKFNLFLFLTIKGLNSAPVIIWKLVPVCVDILIGGVHQRSSVPGVIQAQSVAELMGRHQQQIHT